MEGQLGEGDKKSILGRGVARAKPVPGGHNNVRGIEKSQCCCEVRPSRFRMSQTLQHLVGPGGDLGRHAENVGWLKRVFSIERQIRSAF